MSRKVQSSHGYSVQYVSFTMQHLIRIPSPGEYLASVLKRGGCLPPCSLLLAVSGAPRTRRAACRVLRHGRSRRGSSSSSTVAHAKANSAADSPRRPRVAGAQADSAAARGRALSAPSATLPSPSAASGRCATDGLDAFAAAGLCEPQQHAGDYAGHATGPFAGDSRRPREQRAV